jgi:hypothetical protein
LVVTFGVAFGVTLGGVLEAVVFGVGAFVIGIKLNC